MTCNCAPHVLCKYYYLWVLCWMILICDISQLLPPFLWGSWGPWTWDQTKHFWPPYTFKKEYIFQHDYLSQNLSWNPWIMSLQLTSSSLVMAITKPCLHPSKQLPVSPVLKPSHEYLVSLRSHPFFLDVSPFCIDLLLTRNVFRILIWFLCWRTVIQESFRITRHVKAGCREMVRQKLCSRLR